MCGSDASGLPRLCHMVSIHTYAPRLRISSDAIYWKLLTLLQFCMVCRVKATHAATLASIFASNILAHLASKMQNPG